MNEVEKFKTILSHKNTKNKLLDFINRTTELKLKSISYDSIEIFQSIAEYQFYIIKLIGINENNTIEDIFIKTVKKGKIKESLFCICDLVYEIYIKKNNIKEESKKVTIKEKKKKNNEINEVSVDLDVNNEKNNKINIEVYFIDVINLFKENKTIWRRMEEYIEIDQILIIGIINRKN